MADSYNDAHASTGGKGNERAPVKQHHRMATGQKVNGQSNPYGADKPDTSDKCHGKPY